jgi:hypothetical protein
VLLRHFVNVRDSLIVILAKVRVLVPDVLDVVDLLSLVLDLLNGLSTIQSPADFLKSGATSLREKL